MFGFLKKIKQRKFTVGFVTGESVEMRFTQTDIKYFHYTLWVSDLSEENGFVIFGSIDSKGDQICFIAQVKGLDIKEFGVAVDRSQERYLSQVCFRAIEKAKNLRGHV